MKPNVPISSRDLGNDDILSGLLGQILTDFLKDHVDSKLPAIVESFDNINNRVIVQPLIKMMQSDGTLVSRGTMQIPVFSMGSSKMSLRFNLAEGDLGWIEACDRDISLFLQSLEEEKPNTLRLHSFSDAVFYPDSMRGMDFDADAVMSNADGTVKTEWFSDKIVHTAPTVEIVGDLKVSGDSNTVGEVTANFDLPTSVGLTTHETPTAPDGPVAPPTPGT